MSEATEGKWLGVAQAPGDSATFDDQHGVFTVHAALLRTGRVIFWAGGLEREDVDERLFRSWTWDPSTFSDPDTPLTGVIGRWFLPEFDPGGSKESPPGPEPHWRDNPDVDLFCAHHVTLEDGRLLAVGGTARPPFSKGSKSLFTYDPDAERWTPHSPGLEKGRWYPTAVVLPDGRVAIFSGRPNRGVEPTAEILDSENLRPAIIAGGNRALYIYPGMVMVPGGRIFYVPCAWQYEGANTTAEVKAGVGPTASFRVTGKATGVWTEHTDPTVPTEPLFPDNFLREEGTFLLLPPAQDGRILVIGGGFATNPNHGSDARQQSTEMDTCEILHTQGGQPRWSPAGSMRRPRSNVHAVTLPDGKVLILGGHDGAKRVHDTDHLVPELFDPTVPYDPADPHAAFTDMAPMNSSRLYHAAALLLPDGRVLAAGGEDQDHEHPYKRGNNLHSFEIYEPPYCHQGPRPKITSLEGGDRPSHELGYGEELVIRTQEAISIASVVLMRLGSATHHTDTEQRHVPINFAAVEDRLLAVPTSDPSVAPPGYYMLFIVDDQGRPCEKAEIVRLSHRRCRLVTDRSTFSVDELGPGTSTFRPSFYVHVDGFLPSELGVTTPAPTPASLSALAPVVTITDGGGPAADVSAAAVAMHLEDDTLPTGVRQRVTFEYMVQISSEAAFPADGADLKTLTLEAALDVVVHGAPRRWTCAGTVQLTRQANPFMLDGPTHWLSVDLRVFRVRAGSDPFSNPTPVTDPTGYIQRLIRDWDDLPQGGHPFDTIPEGQRESALQLARIEDGQPVYNFAVARVRYRGRSLNARDVRVFFRMFTTAATNMSYDPDTTYKVHEAGGRIVPLLGSRGADLASIPFFAVPRIDTTESALTEQPEDTANRKTLDPTGGGESQTYFGAWLDINQQVGRFPLAPGGAQGAFAPDSVLSIKDLINGRHQCLVAEVHFADDPIGSGKTPANSDNLAQRNLAIEGSDNPGGPDAHRLALSFEIDPTWNVKEGAKRGHAVPIHQQRVAAAADERAREKEFKPAAEFGAPLRQFRQFDVPDDLRRQPAAERPDRTLDTPQVAFRPPMHAHPAKPVLNWLTPDELMIDWGDLPVGSTAELFIPDLRAADSLELLARRWADRGVSLVDDHTLLIPAVGMSHIPVPALDPDVLPALLTVQLPELVRKGQVFTVTVHQVSPSLGRVVGAFELRVPVGEAGDFVEAEQRWFAVLQDTLNHRPAEHRWTPVLKRMAATVAARLRGFGADPKRIKPSPDGHDPDRAKPCPDPAAHKPGDARDDTRGFPDKETGTSCKCTVCALLDALEDRDVRRTLKALLCKCR